MNKQPWDVNNNCINIDEAGAMLPEKGVLE